MSAVAEHDLRGIDTPADADGLPLTVYFSSVSENTHRFVQKLGAPMQRIPLFDRDGSFRVDQPYVLISPTYGGGKARDARGPVSRAGRGYVPVPVDLSEFRKAGGGIKCCTQEIRS